jgi:NhaC family Na+:H+ antiporter
MTAARKEPSVGLALIPVVFLIGALFAIIVILKQTAHIPLILGASAAAGVAVYLKYPWKEIQDGIVNGINLAMGAILILIIVGTLIGTWISGGIVPAMIYYGLKELSPGIFLAATMVICTIVYLGNGTSW